jgi:dCTP deaminase
MILSAQSIRRLCKYEYPNKLPQVPLLAPYSESAVNSGMTFGLSSAGYDIRIDQDVTLYPITLGNLMLKAIGVKRSSFALASSIEKFTIPKHLMPLVMDKSTWARRGLSVFNTCAEPGWTGWLTLELANKSEHVLEIRKGMPIAQIVFFELDHPTCQPYQGKYQHQARGPQPAILA